jgi:hypothetical protein
MRFGDAGMTIGVVDIDMIDPPARPLEGVKHGVRIEQAHGQHVDGVNQPPLTVIAVERSLGQGVRLDVKRSEPGIKIRKMNELTDFPEIAAGRFGCICAAGDYHKKNNSGDPEHYAVSRCSIGPLDRYAMRLSACSLSGRRRGRLALRTGGTAYIKN